MSYQLLLGDALTVLRTLPANSVQTVCTSPPYYGLRDYGTATWEGGDAACDHSEIRGTTRGGPYSTITGGKDTTPHKTQFRDLCGKCGARRIDSQIGLEESPEAYVAKLVDVFREVKRVLRDDGTLWLNLACSYNGSGGAGGDYGAGGLKEGQPKYPGRNLSNFKPKDMIPIPWMVAMALQQDGYYLRSDIIWHKTNSMPESVTDRPTKAHEYIFLLSKSREYFYDAEAIRERQTESSQERAKYGWNGRTDDRSNGARTGSTFKRMAESGEPIATIPEDGFRNKRSVWSIPTRSYTGAHFATFPPDLIEPCVLAGTSSYGCCVQCGSPWERITKSHTTFEGGSGKAGRSSESANANGKWAGQQYGENIKLGPVKHTTTTGWQPTCTCNADVIPCTVLDPFAGSGTTLAVALKYGRNAIGIELNESYHALAHRRIERTQPMLFAVTS